MPSSIRRARKTVIKIWCAAWDLNRDPELSSPFASVLPDNGQSRKWGVRVEQRRHGRPTKRPDVQKSPEISSMHACQKDTIVPNVPRLHQNSALESAA